MPNDWNVIEFICSRLVWSKRMIYDWWILNNVNTPQTENTVIMVFTTFEIFQHPFSVYTLRQSKNIIYLKVLHNINQISLGNLINRTIIQKYLLVIVFFKTKIKIKDIKEKSYIHQFFMSFHTTFPNTPI